MTHQGEQTTSCWMDPILQRDSLSLSQDAQADVCIIGAGIAGLTTAYQLLAAGQTVIVLDSGGLASGETQRTTAHLSNALDDRFVEIERIHGVEGATLAAASHLAAIDRIEAIVRQEQIVCGFERLDGFLCAGQDTDRADLEQELAACRRAGMTEVELVPGLGLGVLTDVPALRFPRQGQFHPLHYLAGLAAAIHRQGGRIYGNSHVDKVAGGTPARVHTRSGPSVQCSAVVVATNTPINDLVAIHTKQATYRTYAIAAPLRVGALPRALYWDTEDPYHYVRLQPVAGNNTMSPGEELLIVGGEDHKTGQDEQPARRFEALERWTRVRFPALGPVAYRWSGQVMEPIDGLAFIGRNPLDRANVFVATGDSGMGMTHGTIAGLLLAELIQGREHPWADLYSPSRKPLGAVRAFAQENANVAWQYTDWLRGGDVAGPEVILPGQGAVVRQGLRKLAIYRDPAGQTHACSAVCPHLGCVVHWNDVESTWDCPCHGSRFDSVGQVLNGPAVSNLTPLASPREGASVAAGSR